MGRVVLVEEVVEEPWSGVGAAGLAEAVDGAVGVTEGEKTVGDKITHYAIII